MEPNKLIKVLRELKRDDDVMVVLTDEAIDSLTDIVEKYQKIEQILYCHNRYTDDAAECIDKLRGIIKDGR